MRRGGATILLLGFLAFWVNGDNYAAAPMLVRIASDLSLDIGTAALSVTSYMLLFGLLTIVFGPLGDRFGRAHILKVAAFGSAVFSMLSALVWDLPSLIAARAANGAFSAGIMPLAVAYAGESATAESRQARIGQVMGLGFCGGAAATVIGGAVASVGSWQTVYFIYGAAELLIAIPLTFLMRTTDTPAAGTGLLTAYRDVFANRALLRTVGVLFFVGFSTLGTFAYLGKFIQDGTGLGLLVVGCILSAYGIGTLVGGRLTGRLKKVLGARLFPFAGALGFVGLAALGLSGAIPAVAAPALFLYGLGFVLLQSSLITTAQDLLPKRRGAVMSAASFTMATSGALGTLVNGRILMVVGFPVLIGLAGVSFATAGLLALAAPTKRTSRAKVAHEAIRMDTTH